MKPTLFFALCVVAFVGVAHSACVMNNNLARSVEALWKDTFPSASLFPTIGLPAFNMSGVMLLTHSSDHIMKINGLECKSPLCNNALFSSECSGDKYINLYEVMIPDIPGTNGALSTAQIYVNALHAQGLDVAGFHFHWTGSTVFENDKLVAAVHHQKINMDPLTFTMKTIAALNDAMEVVQRRGIAYPVPLVKGRPRQMN